MRKLALLTATLAFAFVAHAEQLTLKIDGMVCAEGCVKAVNDALTKVNGVKSKNVELGKAVVEFDAKKTSKANITAAIEKAGYKVVN
jgi:copper chaperone CopZ